jgi:hypothetical protein
LEPEDHLKLLKQPYPALRSGFTLSHAEIKRPRTMRFAIRVLHEKPDLTQVIGKEERKQGQEKKIPDNMRKETYG